MSPWLCLSFPDSHQLIRYHYPYFHLQIRLHDERARLSIASLVSSPAPVDTPARTPTQRAALERSLSTRIASLQADIERERRRAGLSGPMRRPETEAATRVRANSSASAACPQESMLTTAMASRHHAPPYNHKIGHVCLELETSAYDLMHPTSLLEREWDRQLADGEVDANGVQLRTNSHTLSDEDSKELGKDVGYRNVEGLGFQVASLSATMRRIGPKSPFRSRRDWPICLR